MPDANVTNEVTQPQGYPYTLIGEATWLTYAQVRELYGYSQVTLWRWIKETGDIKVVRVGRTLRINRRSLEDFLESRSEQG